MNFTFSLPVAFAILIGVLGLALVAGFPKSASLTVSSSPSNFAPCLIQLASIEISSLESAAPSFGILPAPAAVTRAMIKLRCGWPICNR